MTPILLAFACGFAAGAAGVILLAFRAVPAFWRGDAAFDIDIPED